MAALTTIAAVTTAAAAVGATYSQIKQAEATEKYQKGQLSLAEESQKEQSKEISRQNKAALEKRKQMVDIQRKQIINEGSYSINQTSSMGVDPAYGSLLGGTLG